MPEDYFKDKKEYYNSEVDKYEEVYFGQFDNNHSLLTARRIIIDQIESINEGEQKVLDIGCGNGGILIPLLKSDYDAYGFDLAEKMVAAGKSHLKEEGFDKDRIKKGDFTQYVPFDRKFDIIYSIGLFSHFNRIEPMLEKVRNYLTETGSVLIQFRNALLSLYSFNQYTYDFIHAHLLDDKDIPIELREKFNNDLANFFEVSISKKPTPPEDDEGGFDNPFLIKDAFERKGFNVEDTLFYNYHALPPEYREINAEIYDNFSAEFENPADWRGHFMASSFIIKANLSG